jgi:putative Ca2+/H+ antiporter (TMEM165/GDT1 family)
VVVVAAFWQSLLLVFLAELGDKTQLASLAFSTRYGPLTALAGVTVATLAVHLLSAALGQALGAALPTPWTQVLAGVAFIGFGLWTLRGETLDKDCSVPSLRFGPFLTVATALLIAELGDKTMLTTVTIASQQQALVPVWLGSTLGMVLSDSLAIALGTVARRQLPARAVWLFAGTVFLAVGLWTLATALLELAG